MISKQPSVYILASQFKGTLYIGVTSNLIKRVWEHKHKIFEGVTQKYQLNLLVYYEHHENMANAIYREKQIKKWNRDWKIQLIEKGNPYWKDLWENLI